MLLATGVAARWITRQLFGSATSVERLGVGLIALAILLSAETGLCIAVRGASVRQILFERDPVSGGVHYVLLILYAVLPWIRGAANGAVTSPEVAKRHGMSLEDEEPRLDPRLTTRLDAIFERLCRLEVLVNRLVESQTVEARDFVMPETLW